MKKIYILLIALLLLPLATQAKVWKTTEEGAMCVSGEGNFKFSGEGTAYLSGAGVFRTEKHIPVEITSGFFQKKTRGKYTYYSGAGDVHVDNFTGTIEMLGGGSGYLEVHGTGRISLKGDARELKVGCNWQ